MTRHLSETERRAQILMAARAVFVESGYLAARVEDIARRANLSKGAVYFYFPSKRAIFDALVDEEHAVTMSFLAGAEQDPRPAQIKLVDLGRAYLDHFAGMKTPPRFFLLMNEMSIRDEDVRRRVNAIHHSFIERIAQIIEQGAREGVFVPYDAIAVAQVLKAMIDGLAGQSAVGVRSDVGRLSGDGVRLLLHGLLARGHAEAP